MKKTSLIALVLVAVMALSSCSIIEILIPTDYKEITNNIFTHYIEMNMTVKTTHMGASLKYETQGSGVIYGEDSTYYYLLTNCHVVAKNSEYPLTSYTVIDCYGKEYKATLLASDPYCDLAVLRFVKGGEKLCIVPLASSNPEIGTEVAILSTSNGLINSVTYGETIKYEPVELRDKEGNVDTTVSIPVIWHTAPMWGGGSGSVLLNMNMELVGINYAVATDEDGRFIRGFAISVHHVRAFLEENNLIK